MQTVPEATQTRQALSTRAPRVAASVPRSRPSRETQALTASWHAHSPAGRGAPGAKRPDRAEGRRSGPGASPASPPSGGPSRYYARNVSALLDPSADLRKQRRHVRHAMLNALWDVSRLKRVRKCRKVPINTVGDVAVKRNDTGAYVSGVATCGSIWACPVCSAKIRAKRATEVSEGAAEWDRRGGAVYMSSFTAPHQLGMRLAPLHGMIADSFRTVLQGRAWQRIKADLGIVGNIRSLEVTCGCNGWHPHLHVLFFFEREVTPEQFARFVQYLRDKWQRAVVKAGYELPSDQYGVKVDRCYSAAEAGEYIAKTQDGRAVGNEVSRSDMKQGRADHRTPFDIFDDFRWTGDTADLARWHEYEQATWGKQAITWSKGLRKLLSVEDKSDDELAEEEVGGEEVARIRNETWLAITRYPGLPAAVLDAAEDTGLRSIVNLLERYGIDASGVYAPKPSG